MRKIRVLVVEDSLMFRDLLEKNLNEDPGIEVVATANDPFEARDAIIEYKPDVMTLDIELPRMNGIDFLKKLISLFTVFPSTVISTSYFPKNPLKNTLPCSLDETTSSVCQTFWNRSLIT